MAESVAPGLRGLGLLVAAVVVVSFWFHLRRLSMLRALRRQALESAGSAGKPDSSLRS